MSMRLRLHKLVFWGGFKYRYERYTEGTVRRLYLGWWMLKLMHGQLMSREERRAAVKTWSEYQEYIRTPDEDAS